MECKYFGECGSCRNYEEGYAEQLQNKLERVTEMFDPLYSELLKVLNHKMNITVLVQNLRYGMLMMRFIMR